MLPHSLLAAVPAPRLAVSFTLHPLRLPPSLHAPQMMREEVRSMTRQLRRVDERLDFMERKMGWRRGWLWG